MIDYTQVELKYGSLERYLNVLITGLKFAELTDITGVSGWLLRRDIENVKNKILKEICDDLEKNKMNLVYVNQYNHVTFKEYLLIMNSI